MKGLCEDFKNRRVQYRGADKSSARPGRKQANVSVRMAWISFGAFPCRKKENLMTARVSLLLKTHASLTCFRAYFLPGRARDLSAPRYKFGLSSPFSLCLLLQEVSTGVELRQSTSVFVTHLNSTSKSLCLQIALILWTKRLIWLLENWFVLLFFCT